MMLLLLSCTLPVTDDDTAQSGTESGTLTDGAFRLDWQQGDVWADGSCVDLTLSNQGEDSTDWRAAITLDAAVEAWTWLDDGLSPDGETALSLLPTDSGALGQGDAVEARYCAQPVALPTSLSAWAITGDDQTGPVSGTIADSTDRVWVSWADSGQRGGVDCLELSVINISTVSLPSWKLEVTLSQSATLTEVWNAYGKLNGDFLTLLPTSGGGLSPSEKWSGWVCLEPLAWPTGATLVTSGGDEDTGSGRDTG
jgi:hypothetical protein